MTLPRNEPRNYLGGKKQCEYCDTKCLNEANLMKHMKHMHEEEHDKVVETSGLTVIETPTILQCVVCKDYTLKEVHCDKKTKEVVQR